MGRETPALTRHVKELWPDFERLWAAAEQVSYLGESPGWWHVMRLLNAEIEAIEATMEAGGTPLSQAEYAVRHGRIGGLKAAEGAVHAIVDYAERRRAEQEAKHEDAAESALER